MPRFASGKYALGECDRCGFAVPYRSLVPDTTMGRPNGLRVCPSCVDAEQPQETLLPRLRVDDPQALQFARPQQNLEQQRRLRRPVYVTTPYIGRLRTTCTSLSVLSVPFVFGSAVDVVGAATPTLTGSPAITFSAGYAALPGSSTSQLAYTGGLLTQDSSRALTLQFWTRWNALWTDQASNLISITSGVGQSRLQFTWLHNNPSIRRLQIGQVGRFSDTDVSTDIASGTWVHVALVIPAGIDPMARVYLNGVQTWSAAIGRSAGGTLDPIIGPLGVGSGGPAQVDIDDVWLSRNELYVGAFTPPARSLQP
jgi:hypothetical protein